MSKNPKELVGPPDPNQDVRNYAERILGIQNGGVEDTVAELTSEKLESTVATLRGYNDKYGLCSENALANQWYLEHLDVDKETRKKMRDVFKNDRLSQNQKIESQYDILKEKYTGENATDEDGDKWKAIEKDKKEIDNIYDTKKSAPKDKKENPKIVKTCNLPKVFLKCVKSSKRESNFAYPQEILDEINKANGTKVDFAAIQVFENGAHNSPSTTGYIPWDKDVPINEAKARAQGRKIKTNSSGVTVATGFDLGSKKIEDLKNLKLNDTLIEKLKPYLGLKTQDACNKLARQPMTPLTPEEVAAIDKAKLTQTTKATKNKWNKLNPKTKFEDLAPERQTMLVSRSIHEGTGWMNRMNYKPFLDAARQDKWADAGKKFSVPGFETRTNAEGILLNKALKDELARLKNAPKTTKQPAKK